MHINKLCRVHLMDRICRADCRTRRSTGEHWVMLTDRHQPPVHCDLSPTYGICWLKVPSHPFDRRKCVFNRQDRQTVCTGLVPLFDRGSRGVAYYWSQIFNCLSRSLFSQKTWYFVTTGLIMVERCAGMLLDGCCVSCMSCFFLCQNVLNSNISYTQCAVCSCESCSTSAVPLFRCFTLH